MSDMEEKITTKDEDNAPKDQDTSNQNIGSTSEGNAKSINPDIIGAKSKNVLQSKSVISDENIQRQSGDSAQKITTNSDKTHLIDKSVKTDSGEGSGDHTTRANDKDEEFNAKASPKDVSDKTELKTGNYDSLVDEFTDDDDMELRWDDDDGNNQVTTDNEKPGMNKLEDILSEEEFFDENEIVTKNSPHQDEAEKSNLNDKLNTNKLEDIESEEEFLEETDTNAKHSKAISNTVILMQKTIAKEKALEDILSEEEFLEETDGNADISKTFPGSDSSAGKSKSYDQDALEGITQSKVNTEKLETDIALEDSVDNINADTSPIRKENVEEELLKEPDINLEQNVKTKNADTIKSNLDTVRENSKDMAEDILLKENESKTTAADMDITIEESLDNTIEAELLQETDTNPEEKETTQESEQNTAKDIEESDNKILEETLLEETETVKTSEINPDADLMNEDLLLEDKLLEEPKTITKAISVVDAPELEKVINTGVVENEDTILEDKLLEETEVIGEIPDEDVSMEKVDDQQEEELLKDDQDESCTAMDVDNTDPEANKDQEIGSNKIEKTIENLEETEIRTDLNRSEVQIKDLEKTTLEDKSEPDTTIIETITKDGIPLNTSTATEQKSDTPTKSLEDSPVRIKTDHSLHKPDAMLEIPTQELIDIDDTDLSMNLDQSEAFDSPIDVDKTVCEDDIVNQKTVDQKAVVSETIVDKDSTDATTVDNVEKSTENVEERIENVSKNIDNVDNSNQNVEESIDIAKNDENVDKSIENPEKSTETVNKAIEDVEKNAENVKSTENAEKNIDNTEKTTENVEKSIHNIENRTDDIRKSTENIDKSADSVEKIAKDSIEESLERMFADDDHTAVEEVVECKASTSQTPDVTPSTSNKMTPDTSDEVPEVSDSLGLLAESSGRVMEDDEEPEDDDDGDDDDDFDQDESSNQISAEQSEDSNPPPSETEPARDEKEIDTPEAKEDEFQFTISNIESKSQDKLDTIMDIEVEEEKVEMPVHAANDDETQSAVEALLKDVEGPSAEENKDTAQQQMDIETVKLSDTSDTEADDIASGTAPTEDQLVPEQSKMEIEEKQDKTEQSPSKVSPTKQKLITQSPSKPSPSKMKKLEITTLEASSVVNIVDLEESSSSEDDIQEVPKQPETESPQSEEKQTTPEREDVTNVNIPTGIEVMCTSGGNTSEIVTKEGEVVISGVPKPPPHKPARLNTSEVSIKTVASAEPLVIPETKMNEPSESDTKSKTKLSLEIFSLDSDDDEGAAKEKPAPSSPIQPAAEEEEEKPSEVKKCINDFCTSGGKETFIVADAAAMAYYDARRKRRAMLCLPCADVLAGRTKKLIQGIKDMTPLMELEMGKLAQDLVEISDSESEDEDPIPEEPKESIGETGAKFLEENLTALMNETWRKYNLDVRLRETQIMLDDEIEKLEQDSREIDAMLSECQVATDKLRSELYATFEHRRQETPALCIYDTPEQKYIVPEIEQTAVQADVSVPETRQAKRRLSSTSDAPAKRPAIPLGYAPLDADTSSCAKEPKPATSVIENKMDDDKDISVVKLSAEAAPADLPPPGELARPALRVGMPVYAMKNAFGPWLKGRILEMQPKNPNSGNSFTVCRVKFDHKTKTNGKVLPARCIAYAEPADVRMTIGTRLIALFKDSNKRESYYSGVVAEIPNPVNNYRYLVFFDDGYAQYVQHAFTRLVCEYSPLVWEEVHPFSREFVREYLLAYPERPMVRLHEGQHLKTEWNGKWWSSLVTKVDASLAQVRFLGDGRREWVYRGSTRLAPLYLELRAAERHRPRPMPRSKAQPRLNMPYVEYTRSDEPDSNKQPDTQTQQQQNEEIRRQRAVAKKSTTVAQVAPPPQQHPVVPGNLDTVTSRVVYYTPKNAVKPYKMVPHKCGPKCKRTDVLTLKELRTYNPLAKPLLSGWERQIVRFKGHKEVMYRAPCGRRVRSVRELHAYLRAVASDLPVDLFDFHHATHCLAEFVLNKCLVGKKDLSHGKENVPVPCVNYYDDSLPEFCSYNTERTPTAGVPLNLDPEFLCGCDCTDDCQDKSKCACWKMTLEGARTIGLHGPNVGYVYKRLPEPLPSGIYECNSRCKCKHTCLNRVAQHPLQLKLQVFKTLNRGWGIRALNDVPKGSFLCVYAGNLLTDATANLDGLNEGDEYLAELDYIEVVEQMKEGYEEDIPEADKKLDKKEGGKDGDDDDDEEPSSSEDEDTASKTDKEDDDFRPGYIGLGVTEFNKRLRRREKNKKEKEEKPAEEKEKDKETKETSANPDEDCITISDDEEVREPSRFTVQAGMGANEFISKYKSVRTLFGKDEACYIMDAKVQGNIGRYLNHSCCPNVFVQNVFVDTHDPRFPWVAFFALSHIKAGTELTWNYNYDVGSVPGKILYCFCGAPNCRGRLL